MVKKIIWTKKAQREFEAMLTYFEDEASEKTAENFYKLVVEKLERIEKYPESGRIVKAIHERRSVNLDKYRQMFYRIAGKSLYITDFFDMRQNPSKHPYFDRKN
jgi:plasmid stabilization system protein ParE